MPELLTTLSGTWEHLRELLLVILDRSRCTLTIIYHCDDDRFLIRVVMHLHRHYIYSCNHNQPQPRQESDVDKMSSSSIILTVIRPDVNEPAAHLVIVPTPLDDDGLK